MDGAALTAAYLEDVRRSGTPAAELDGDPETRRSLFRSYSPDTEFLTRPLFIGRPEVDRLHADVELVRQVVASLPERRFGGSMTAFAQAVGAEGYQVTAAEISRSEPASPQGRADLYRDASGFKLMEFNLGSALGGLEVTELCQAMLGHPALAKFAATHQLTFVDSMAEEVVNLRAATGFGPATSPVVAVTDWPRSYERSQANFIHALAARWRDYGLDACGCHLSQLEYRGGKVWLDGREVDVIARKWVSENLLEPDAAELLDPVFTAVARGDVQLFTPMDVSICASKAALAMVSGEDGRDDLDPAERAAVDRLLPWTREMRPGLVTLEDGHRVDLYDYALSHQDDLVLKPSMGYGGHGVRPGWDDQTTPLRWRQQLDEAMLSPFVLQRRIRPVSQLFPAQAGPPEPWVCVWGLFTMVNGFGGILARGVPAAAGATVLNVSSGARIGCCLYPVTG